MLFRIISIMVFAVTLGCVAVGWLASRPSVRPTAILKKLVFLLTLVLFKQRLTVLQIIRKLIYLVALFCFVILLVSGFWFVLVSGESLSGYLMMLHATFAGVFSACLALLVLMWAYECKFGSCEWQWLIGLFQRKQGTGGQFFAIAQKVVFWVIMFLALPLILSVVLSMFRYFGTTWQGILLEVHRYTALVFSAAVIIHTFLLIRVHRI